MPNGNPGPGTPSRIERVRVYRSGATVTRVVELAVAPTSIDIVGLPLCLVDSTVRVRVKAGGVSAGAPGVGLFARAPEDLPEPPEEAALRELRRTIERDEARVAALRAEIEVLSAIEVPPRPSVKDGPPRTSPMAARVALERFTHDNIDQRLETIRDLEAGLQERREDLVAQEDALRRANRRNLAERQTVSKAIRFGLRGRATGPLLVEVDYHVPGARWAPSYQCHVDTRTGSASIHQRAVVAQDTGEDWSRVRLELSTALPQRFSELPELAALRIGKAQPPADRPGFRPAPRGAAALFADFDRGPRPEPVRPGFLHRWIVDDAPLRERFVEEAFAEEVFDEAPAAGSGRADFEDDTFVGLAMADEPAPPPMMERSELAAAPEPEPMAAPSRSRRRASPKKKAARKPSAPKPSITEPAPGLPDFAALVLAGARSADRGSLVPLDPRQRYLRSLDALGLALDSDLDGLLRDARRRAEAPAALALPSAMVDVASASGAFDYTYPTEHRVDVPSAPAFHSVPLATRETTVGLTYVVVPRVDPNVFRVAAIDNPTAAPLLPGPVEVYVGGRYVLSSQIPLVGPGSRFQLGLGVEQGVRCARNTQFRETRSGSAVVAMNELHHTIAIELHNQLDRPIEAEIRERLPAAAKGAEVAVEEIAVEPAWEPWDQRSIGGGRLRAGRRWKLSVGAGERATLSAHYVVKIYANNEIVGGNRREA